MRLNNYYLIRLSILLLALFQACTVADNQNCSDSTLLTLARNGKQSKIDACYKSGASILISNKEGKTIRTVALAHNHRELAAYLVNIQTKGWIKDNSPYDTASLWNAIEYDNVAIIKKYIEQGIDVNKQYLALMTPIVYAIFNESTKVIELLLSNGANVHQDFDSRPLICMAAMFNEQEVVSILLKYGASVNEADGSAVTPLMFATRDTHISLVKFLLTNGADKSLRDIRYQTAYDMVNNNEKLKKMLAE